MRLLIVHSFFPEPDTNAGSLRLWEILRLLRASGHSLSFLAPETNDQKYRRRLEGLGVECVSDEGWTLSASEPRLKEFLRDRAFDAAILLQYGIFNHYAPYLRAFLPRCRLIFDTVDLHFLRAEREAAIEASPAAWERAARVRREELAAARNADAVWVVSEAERLTLKNRLPDPPPIQVVGLIHRAAKTPPPREGRRGAVFLGGYRHAPNVDAVHHFFRDIHPELDRALPGLEVTIAGSHLPAELRRYEGRGVVLAGFVEDHRALLGSALVGIAPLRYGAGMKGKLGEYLACGLPCVTTSIGSEGMGLVPGEEALIEDDPAQFARSIVSLHRDARLWERLSAAGIGYVRERLSPEAAASSVREGLRAASRTFSYKAITSSVMSWAVRG